MPGPRLPAWAQTLGYGLWPQRYLHWCDRRFGDRFTLQLPTLGTTVVVSDPASIRDAFALRSHQVGVNGALLEPFLGPRSLLCQDGALHDRQRRLLARAFRPEALSSYTAAMESIVADEVSSWPSGRAFALHPRFQRITLEVILRVAFGIDATGRLDELRASLAPFLHRAGSLLVLNPGFRRSLRGRSPWARFQRLRADVLAALLDEIGHRRSTPDLAQRTDVLSSLLLAEDAGDRLEDEEVLDNLLTMLLAGHDTTATALAWTFDLLVHNPAVMERLRGDVASGDSSYLRAVIKEAMRLRPVIVDTGRTLVESAELGGVRFDAGTVVSPSILLAHHRSDSFPHPMRFRPERFLHDGAPQPFTWLPFGGGARRCLGAGFATLEMEVVTRAVLERCAVSRARRRPESQRRRAVTLVPRHGTTVVVERLAPAAGSVAG